MSENETVMRAVDFRDKQTVVDLLMRVQGGFISCRKAASVLIAIHDGEQLCEGCCGAATTSDSEGVPLCADCLKSLEEEQPTK